MPIKHVELHKNADKEQWPKLFFVHGFRRTQITARTESLIDFPGVAVVKSELPVLKINQSESRPSWRPENLIGQYLTKERRRPSEYSFPSFSFPLSTRIL